VAVGLVSENAASPKTLSLGTLSDSSTGVARVMLMVIALLVCAS
jgi:hypothetical protein